MDEILLFFLIVFVATLGIGSYFGIGYAVVEHIWKNDVVIPEDMIQTISLFAWPLVLVGYLAYRVTSWCCQWL